MQLEVSPEYVDVLTDCVEQLIAVHLDAKQHTLTCPSVESVEMLTEIEADYDLRRLALREIDRQLRSASA